MMNWYLKVWKNYAVFSGRARRKEYWFFFLFNVLIAIVLRLVDGALFAGAGVAVLSLLFGLAVFLPGLAVMVRRLHDTDRSGWWVLISLIPLIGPIVLLVFMSIDGTPGQNRFGPNPVDDDPQLAPASPGVASAAPQAASQTPNYLQPATAQPPTVVLQGQDMEGHRVAATIAGQLLARGTVAVGRGTAADVAINHIEVSRVHLLLEWLHGELRVRDNRSTNGTFLNGRPVASGYSVPLHSGDMLTLGTLRLSVSFA